MNLKTIYGLALGPFVLLILLFAGRLIHGSWSSEGFAISLLIGTAGVVTGWLIGLLTSPYNDKEQKKFSVYASGLTGLVSGYFFTKMIDPTLTQLFKDGSILTNSIYGVNFLIFLVAMVVSMIGGYSYREYLPNSHKIKNTQQDGADQPATAPDLKLEGEEKPKTESEDRSQ